MPTIKRSNFYLNCRDELTEQAIWLSTVVENIGQKHMNLVNGARFQIGWSILKLVATPKGLILCEPDFDSDPFQRFREDVSSTLAVLSAQRDLVSKVGCEPEEVRFDDKVIIFKGCLDESGLYGQRSPPSTGDSGWYFGPTREHRAPTVNDLEAVWVYELLHRKPALLPALCLPANWMVVWEGSEIVGIADPDNRERLR